VAYGWFNANLRTIWQREGIYTTSFEDEPKGLEALQGLWIRDILRFRTEIALAVSFGGHRGTRNSENRGGRIMNEPQEATDTTLTRPAAAGLGATLLRAAWLAILLGFAMEALLLLFAAGFGILPGFESVVSDLAGKVTWSTLVCAGLALGTAASKARAPLMGLFGLLAAPFAFHVSRALQQGVAKTIEEVAAGVSVGSQPLLVLALLKAVEYGCLGVTIGWVGGRPWGGALAHAAAGLAVGILFGSVIVSFMHWTAPEPLTAAELFSRGINEVLFPIGCSLVLYTATTLGKRV
jgi:hypothetical protein